MNFPTECGSPAWFALTVRPRHERATAENLELRGLDSYIAWRRVRRRWSDRVKVMEENLFPGYVFCRFGYEDRLSVLNLPGVQSIVGFGKVPAPVADSEIDRDLLSRVA